MGPNTSADGSCAAQLNGEMLVFGGSENNKQVYSYNKLFHVSQHLKFRSVKLKTAACNVLVNYQPNSSMVHVERFYLQLKKELCFASH